MGKLRELLNDLEGGNCALPLALEAMGERWSFMILRAAFNGVHHFEEFQQELNIARNILSNRLSKLVDHGIMARDVQFLLKFLEMMHAVERRAQDHERPSLAHRLQRERQGAIAPLEVVQKFA